MTQNENLMLDLIVNKILLRNQLNEAEDTIKTLRGQLKNAESHKQEFEDESKRLLNENEQLRETLQLRLGRLELDISKTHHINNKYKEISSNLSLRLEYQLNDYLREKKEFFSRVKECSICSPHFMAGGILAPTSLGSCSSQSDKQVELDAGLVEKVNVPQESMDTLALQLAATKLALIQSELNSQDLSQELARSEKEVKDLREENDELNNMWNNRAVLPVKYSSDKTSTSPANSTWLDLNGSTGSSAQRSAEWNESTDGDVTRENSCENIICTNAFSFVDES